MSTTKTITRGTPEEQAAFDYAVGLEQQRQEIEALKQQLGVQVSNDPSGGPTSLSPAGLALGGAALGYLAAGFLGFARPALYALGGAAAGYGYGAWRDSNAGQ